MNMDFGAAPMFIRWWLRVQSLHKYGFE